MKSLFNFFLLSLFITSSGWANSYLMEDVPFPAELPPEIGDLAFDQNGKLYACLRRGDVVVSQPIVQTCGKYFPLYLGQILAGLANHYIPTTQTGIEFPILIKCKIPNLRR